MNYESTLVISQEFFDVKNIRQNIPQFVNSLKSFFTSNDNKQKLVKTPQYSDIKNLVEKTNYANIREVRVFVPAGLTVPYVTYIKELENAVDISEKIMDDVLNPFSRWLGLGISNPDIFKNVRVGRGIEDFNPHNTDGVALDIGKCFKKGGNVNKVPFKQAFFSNAQVKEAYLMVEDLNGRMVTIDRSKVLKKIQEITDLLERLISRMEDKEENYELSEVSLELLSKLSYTVAKEVEFFGFTSYQLTALTTAIIDTNDVLKKF